MFKSPWDTFPCRQYASSVSKTEEAIRAATIVHDITRTVGEDLRVMLPDVTTIQPFGHPILVEYGDQSYFVGDTRTCTKVDRTGKFSITSPSEYNIWLQRLVVQKRWELGNHTDIWNLGTFQTRIFSAWVGDNIKRRFGLEVTEHLRLIGIAAYFHYCMSDIPVTDYYSETDINNIASVLSRNTHVDHETYVELMTEIPIMHSVDDLIRAIQQHSGTVRLKSFNIVALYQILGGTWFGTNAREIAAIAIEHPPTFAVLLYNAITNNGYKNAGLSQTVKPYLKHEQVYTFKANFDHMLMETLENV